jgi:hypothetical protein
VGEKALDAETLRRGDKRRENLLLLLRAYLRVSASASKKSLGIYLLLIPATLAVYSAVTRFDFVNFDDPDYITNNSYVRQGITADGIEWALTSTEAASWFPVTRLSHNVGCPAFRNQSRLAPSH